VANWTWSTLYGGGVNSSRQTPLAASYGLHRTCAHGVRITCPGAPTSVTGNLHIAIIATSDFGQTTWNFPTTVSEMSNAMFYRKYPLAQLTQQGLTCVNKFLDCTSTRYIDVGSDGIQNANDVSLQHSGFATIIVVVEGAPATTTVLSVENVMHLECIPLANAVDNGTPAAPFNTQTLQEVSRMSAQTPGAFTESEAPGYYDQVRSALGQGISRGSNLVFQNLVLPAARNAGMRAAAYAGSRAFGLPGVTNYRNPSAFERLMPSY